MSNERCFYGFKDKTKFNQTTARIQTICRNIITAPHLTELGFYSDKHVTSLQQTSILCDLTLPNTSITNTLRYINAFHRETLDSEDTYQASLCINGIPIDDLYYSCAKYTVEADPVLLTIVVVPEQSLLDTAGYLIGATHHGMFTFHLGIIPYNMEHPTLQNRVLTRWRLAQDIYMKLTTDQGYGFWLHVPKDSNYPHQHLRIKS